MIHARTDYDVIQDPRGKIGEDEPVFLLRAQDQLFVPMLLAYMSMHMQTVRDSANMAVMDSVVSSLADHVTRAIEWQRRNKTKRADMNLADVRGWIRPKKGFTGLKGEKE